MSGKTHTNPFTKEQMDHLRANPYVKSISSSTIRYTEEFKKYFCQKRKAGVPVRQIFLDCGIDPEIVGQRRIEGFRYYLNKKIKRGEGFTDKRQDNYRRPTREKTTATVDDRIRELEHELAYTRQEVEFLKKLQMADMEARRQWESKHQPK